MAVVKGDLNSWQTGARESHAIEICGARTGHAVRAVAFCDHAETAELLVDALKMLKGIWELDRSNEGDLYGLLERAGLVG